MGHKGIQQQIDALSQYRGVMWPHPRSPEALVGLAAYRGEAGLEYAEAFAYVFRWGL